MSESSASEKPYSSRWSKKEILGHLIDSASNNHQRIVRMQESADIGTFRYAQEFWVQAQKYQERPWLELVDLWKALNIHLVHIIARIDPAALNHVFDAGQPEPITLKAMVDDYVDHLNHHLEQIFSKGDPRERKPRDH